ncbi:MAG: PDZ domain-containing protein [Alphaproteobacteria bacterium]|nr:PDZ domain-containing protein [Alphaproteobacteria bacterium]
MKLRSKFLREPFSRLCLLALMVTPMLIGACTPLQNFTTSKPAQFTPNQATEVFAAGYGGISEKYIDAVSVEEIALEGLRGLGAIDPDLTVTRTPSKSALKPDTKKAQGTDVVLQAAGEEIIRRPAPPADDINGWASLTTEFSVAARQASLDLQSSGMETIYEAVFDGVLSNLDIFSRYSGADEARSNRSKRDGFGGIGIRYKAREGLPMLTSILPKTPAEKAGLKKGDILTHANGVSLKDLGRKAISVMLRGPTQTRVALTFLRPGESQPRTVSLKRAHIFPVTVTQTIKDGIVTLKVSSFNQDTARSLSEKLETARSRLGDKMLGVVLDLRGNPGGLLKQSVKVADLLLTQGKIISTRGRHADSIHHYEAGGRDLASGLPVVVLVDGKSASAAEIVAAALQDRDRAVVIGTASFGKGSVQTVLRLPNDGEITLTWSRLVAPSGYMFHGLGIRPTICTSGLKDRPVEIVSRIMQNRSIIEDMLLAWRKPAMQAEETRNRLRESCPSQRRHKGLELQIARHLITRPALFARALDLTAATHQARN